MHQFFRTFRIFPLSRLETSCFFACHFSHFCELLTFWHPSNETQASFMNHRTLPQKKQTDRESTFRCPRMACIHNRTEDLYHIERRDEMGSDWVSGWEGRERSSHQGMQRTGPTARLCESGKGGGRGGHRRENNPHKFLIAQLVK